MDIRKPTALEQAMKFLSIRGHSQQELAAKLRRKGFAAAEIEAAVADCRRYGFINDEALAADYATLLASRGCGEYLVMRKLREKGLGPEAIAGAMPSLAESEVERARAALDFKLRMLRGEKDPRRKREKCYRFLVSRGFSSATITGVMAPGQEDF